MEPRVNAIISTAELNLLPVINVSFFPDNYKPLRHIILGNRTLLPLTERAHTYVGGKITQKRKESKQRTMKYITNV